jgi:hypothetical protein
VTSTYVVEEVLPHLFFGEFNSVVEVADEDLHELDELHFCAAGCAGENSSERGVGVGERERERGSVCVCVGMGIDMGVGVKLPSLPAPRIR